MPQCGDGSQEGVTAGHQILAKMLPEIINKIETMWDE